MSLTLPIIDQGTQGPPVIRQPAPSAEKDRFAAVRNEVLVRAREDFSAFLSPLLTPEIKEIVSGTMISWDYSDIVSFGGSQTGADFWESVRLDGDSEGYKNPRYERDLIQLKRAELSRLAPFKLAMTSLGSGTYDAVVTSEYEILWALNAKSFNAFDINRQLAKNAASYINNKLRPSGRKVITRSHHGDFFAEWPEKLKTDVPMFATMLGGTLSQYDANEFFGHFAQMTGESSVLFFTADCNRINPLNTYQGPTFRKFKENIWRMIKTAAGDSEFDPSAISYLPEWDGERVIHRYVVTRDTALTIDDQVFPLSRGTFITTGYSRRPTPESFVEAGRDTGGQVIPAGKSREGDIHGFYFIGDKFPYKQQLVNG